MNVDSVLFHGLLFIDAALGVCFMALGILIIMFNSWSAPTLHALWGGLWTLVIDVVQLSKSTQRTTLVVHRIFSAVVIFPVMVAISVWSITVDSKYSTSVSYWSIAVSHDYQQQLLACQIISNLEQHNGDFIPLVPPSGLQQTVATISEEEYTVTIEGSIAKHPFEWTAHGFLSCPNFYGAAINKALAALAVIQLLISATIVYVMSPGLFPRCIWSRKVAASPISVSADPKGHTVAVHVVEVKPAAHAGHHAAEHKEQNHEPKAEEHGKHEQHQNNHHEDDHNPHHASHHTTETREPEKTVITVHHGHENHDEHDH